MNPKPKIQNPKWLAPLFVATAGAFAGPLDDIAVIHDGVTSHRASSYDRRGGNEDSLVSFSAGATHVLLDTDGPGKVTHIWLTAARFQGHEFLLRDLVLRMYWDGAKVPSVEVPLGDFFGLGHGRLYAWQSLPMAVGLNPAAMNCYWPMPFRTHARIEVHNAGQRSIRRLYYNVDYELGSQRAEQGLFHALFRREPALKTQTWGGNHTGGDNYVILDAVGRGQYVGCFLFVDAEPGGWWGEGDDMIFIDGAEKPTMIGTGSEDYFCNAWGYKEAFSYPFYGAPLWDERPDGGKTSAVYRWHVTDPVRFSKSIRVTMEHLTGPDVKHDYSSVAYWYQAEPVAFRPSLPPTGENQPRPTPTPRIIEVDGTELEPAALAAGHTAVGITANLNTGYTAGGWLKIESNGKPIRLPVSVPQPGTYRIEIKLADELLKEPVTARLEGGEARQISRAGKPQGEVPFTGLGTIEVAGKAFSLELTAPAAIGIDHLRLTRLEP